MSSEKNNENQKKPQEIKSNPKKSEIERLFSKLTARDFRTKNDAIKKLGRIKDPQARTKLFEIAESEGWNSQLRISALDSLGRKRRDVDFEKLLENLATDKSHRKELRRAALTQLSKYRDPKTIDIFTRALDDDYRFIRFWAVRGLIKIDDPKATAALINALGDESEEIRKEVRAHIETMGPNIIPALIKAYKKKNAHKFLRYGVLGILGRKEHPDAFKLLIDALKDGNDRVVTIALRGLGRMNNPDAIPALIDLYRNDKEKKRHIENTIYRIGRAEQKVTLLYLVGLLKDEDTDVKNFAIGLMKRFSNTYLYLSDLVENPEVKEEIRAEIKAVMAQL